MRSELGSVYTAQLRRCFEGRVPGGADLVTYWFEKARAQVEANRSEAVGLVATNSIRGGANRRILERIGDSGRIFEAWSDEPWVNDGAAVRVSLVAFAGGSARLERGAVLDGAGVTGINADLTEAGLDLTQARVLPENQGASFQGTSKKASFNIAGALARQWLIQPNPNGRPNSDVVRRWSNGLMLAGRVNDGWIIDYGIDTDEYNASLYEAPFAYVLGVVKPERMRNNRESYRRYWWRHAEARPAMRKALAGLPRFIATIAHSKHRFFVWLDKTVCPDQALIVIARSDDLTFGILHSRFHELWALRQGTSLEDRPRYTPTTTFETFPFPAGMTPADTISDASPCPLADAIADAAKRLNELRENWLNPPEWVERTPEVVPGYPDRMIPKPGHEAELKRRTLTNLYNQCPAWLDNAHKVLDLAVAAAYGWADYAPDMPDDEILRRLLALNLARSEVICETETGEADMLPALACVE